MTSSYHVLELIDRRDLSIRNYQFERYVLATIYQTKNDATPFFRSFISSYKQNNKSILHEDGNSYFVHKKYNNYICYILGMSPTRLNVPHYWNDGL